ncbi:PID-CTERM protein-sorting domain-containing protein [Thermoflexibacter ruber]|uniref:VPEID-CTERM protein sorting domain-containing protein n=1 Tax=Thermoflexibacter ruber TaxID=1003 RepID=A0A1I2EBM6_9BACT|nr:hypothetical protein [Thermoflexibacter ruber]SFE89888.1 hypothetical protein SAMN04488541_100987 [Thermoflexibacter ruber]
MKPFLLSWLALLCLLFLDYPSFAQAGVDPMPPNSGAVPIDGGVLGLLAAGALYGAKKLNEKRKSNT